MKRVYVDKYPEHVDLQSGVALCQDFGLAIFLAVGIFGALWVQDDFDAWRLLLFAYGGVPLAGVYFALRWFFPGYISQRPRLRLTILVGATVIFATGWLALLNAITARDSVVKRTVAVGSMLTTRDTQRGGLGLLFKKRW